MNRYITIIFFITFLSACGNHDKESNPISISDKCTAVPDGYCNAMENGTCYYIDSIHGDDNNPGTFDQPWKTTVKITKMKPEDEPDGWVGLSPGDVVYFMEGTYTKAYDNFDDAFADAMLNIYGVNGTASAPIVIRNYPGHHAILDLMGNGMAVHAYSSSYIYVYGLDIRNSYYRGILFHTCDHIKTNNVQVFNTDGSVGDNVAGIEVAYTSDFELSNSVIYDNYDRTAAGSGNQTENSCNIVMFTNSGLISVHDNIIFQTGDPKGSYSGCGIKYKHASEDHNSEFNVYSNYFENHKYTSLGIGTHHAHVHHNIFKGVGSTYWGPAHAIDSRDWGGPTHQQYMVIEYNTIYAERAFLFIPTLSYLNADNGPWDDLNNNVFKYNIVYTTVNSESNFSGDPPIELYTAMSDTEYQALKDGISFDYNCYYNPYHNTEFGFAESTGSGSLGGRYSLSLWQSEYGWDLHSYETNPVFTDPDGTSNFTSSVSQCSGKGALTGGYEIETRKVFNILCQDGFDNLKMYHLKVK